MKRTFFRRETLAAVLFCCVFAPTGISQQPSRASLYHEGWIDFNKNGRMDPYENPKLQTEKRIDDLLSQMTMEEKTCQLVTLYGYGRVLKDPLPTPQWKNEVWKDGLANMDEQLNGVSRSRQSRLCWPASTHAGALNTIQRFFVEQTRLGIPVDFTDEGVCGLNAMQATSFPMQSGQGCTWDRALIRRIGEITGSEAKAMGFTNVYSPIMDVARDQRWGRCEEVYGESPYLVAELGLQMIRGIQSQGIVSTLKHYAVYGAPKGGREGQARTDPQVAPREVEDIHLYTFRRAFEEAHPMGVMSSYNDYDGIPISGSSYWLTDRLRKEFGFNGYVVSDSDAVVFLFRKHHVAGSYEEAVAQFIEAGGNVRTTFNPPEVFVTPLRKAIRDGRLPMSVIDARVRDVLRVKFWEGLFDHPYVPDPAAADAVVMSADHLATALRASRESLVLLKNADRVLPLDATRIRTVAVCGPNADDQSYARRRYGPQDEPVTTVLAALRKRLGDDHVLYTKGCNHADARWPESEILPEPLTAGEQAEIDKAVAQAKQADAVVVVAGDSADTCGEDHSRTSLDLPGRQLDLIKAVSATGKPVVLVLIGGRPSSINWPDRHVPAIIQAFWPGAQGGQAIVDVLFGDYNPGGKLSFTFPKTAGQIPLNFPTKPNANTFQGNHGSVADPLYPFGYGLSYTTFKYSDLQIDPKQQKPDGDIHVSMKVRNTGAVAGDEVVQLYTRDEVSSVTTYEKNLRGFERVPLQPGEEKTVSFTLKPMDLSLLNRQMKRVVEPGDFKIMIGASSADIRLEGTFQIVP